jgi:site-specific recombinase XerD
MDDEFAHNVEEVMVYLAVKARSKWAKRRHRECFSRLAAYLSENDLPYSEDAAWEWFDGIAAELDKTSRGIYVGALGKMSDLYTTGEIRPFHYRAPKLKDRLYGHHRQLLEDYCGYLGDSGLAPATVGNHRAAATRFLLDLQQRSVECVADAGYGDLIGILLECEKMTYCAKTGYREKIRSILAYLHLSGLVRYGFTLLVDAMALKKGYCWNSVCAKVVAALRDEQAMSAVPIASEDYLGLVESLVQEHREQGYSHEALCSVSHFAKLLYLFMDINGLDYDPQVGRVWAASLEASLSYGEFSSCRRVVMLLEQSFEGIEHDLSRLFVFRETLCDRLPKWCAPEVDAFLAMKKAEGWKKSTLTMFKTCVCRFCMFIDSIGITDFADITAEHVKKFNVADPHETPEGKNAYNSRIRQFLDWLGSHGALSNPYLFLALPNVAAPRETTVVTLTSEEQCELVGVLDGDGQNASFRDRAMLELGLCMGIRASDVVGLVAEDIDWDDATVRFVQAKTGYEVKLPMPTDVANALYRYIVAERPVSLEKTVFVRCRAPYTSVSATVAQDALRKALPERDVSRSGFHSLRRTYATNMLASGTNPHMLAEALGHRGIDNVHKYLSLDEKRMRLCAMSLEESGLVLEGGFADEL